MKHRLLIIAIITLMLLTVPAFAKEPATPSPPDNQQAEAEKLLRQFFSTEGEKGRKEIAEKFSAIAPKSMDELSAMLHRVAPLPDHKAGVHEFETAGEGFELQRVKYIVRVPADYKADAGLAWPVVVGCHGTGGSAEGQLRYLQGLLGPDAEKYLLVCIDSPQKGVYRPGQVMSQYPVTVLGDVRHRFNVDSNRVVLTGYSKGGYTAWGTAAFYPGEWAGAMPMAGWLATEAASRGNTFYLRNLLGLSVQSHWGENDIVAGQKQGINTFCREIRAEMNRLRAKRFEGIEYPGQGHGLNIDRNKVREFLVTARREPFPDSCDLVFHHHWQGHAYYVHAAGRKAKELDFQNLPRLRVSGPGEVESALRKLMTKHAYEIEVRLNPKANRLAIKTKRLQEVDIELPAGKLDYSRPLQVMVNGRVVLKGRQRIDYFQLLEQARKSYDFDRMVAMRLTAKCRSRLRSGYSK